MNDHNLRPNNRKGAISPSRQLREMQAVLYADVMDSDTKPAVRAACARAFDVLQERRDILRMRPAPKPVDVSKDYSPRGRKRTRVAAGVAASDPVALPTPTPVTETLGNS